MHWNKLLFERAIPEAWVELLRTLAQENQGQDVFPFWPGMSIDLQGDSGYWSNMVTLVMRRIFSSGTPVWPVARPVNDSMRYMALDSSILVCSTSEEGPHTSALAHVRVNIVRLPPQIYAIVHQSGIPVVILNSKSARRILLVCSYFQA